MIDRRVRLIILLWFLLAGVPALASQEISYYQDWESGIADWSASNGVWQVGTPTAGSSAHQGVQCAATVLNGNYPYGANSRLVSPEFTLPATPPDGQIWLGFWHWFSFSLNDGTDYGDVQIWQASTGTWTTVSHSFWGNSVVWTPFYVDLSAYAGQTVRIGFRMVDLDGGGSPNHYEGPGWHVDEVRLLAGAFTEMASPTSFDARAWDWIDWDGWYPDRGVWEVGHPTAGCTAAFSGEFCAGTVLTGNYPYAANSRLISPPVALAPAPRDGILRLCFRQWGNLSWSDGADYGLVEIYDGTTWTTLSPQISYHWGGWSECVVDISAFSGQVVRVGFRMVDVDGGGSPSHYESPGWYLDDVSIVEGEFFFNNPTDFENGAPGWTSPTGVWAVGDPNSGPGSAHSGETCWGTILGGNYPYGCNDELLTTAVTLPANPSEPLTLRIWHWFSFSTSDGTDKGTLRIHPEDGTAVTLAEFTGTSNGWSQYGPSGNLAAYAGQTVRFGFRMTDVDGGGSPNHYESSGWYIDDLEIVGMTHSAPQAPLHDYTHVQFSPGPAQISWVHLPIDIAEVAIYGSPVEGFVPSIGTRLAVLPGTVYNYTDTAHVGWDDLLHYRVSVIDIYGHESFAQLPSEVTPVPEGVSSATATGLRNAVPNPFNPSTEITFYLGAPMRAELSIFDLRGRLVATLLNAEIEAGDHTALFAPRDLASGVYFARLVAGGAVHVMKLMLVE